MKRRVTLKGRAPTGRPPGIPQPKGPERIKRKMSVIYDSLLKQALAGNPDAARLCLELAGEIKPTTQVSKKFKKMIKGLRVTVA
jgi:hypothetical protein